MKHSNTQRTTKREKRIPVEEQLAELMYESSDRLTDEVYRITMMLCKMCHDSRNATNMNRPDGVSLENWAKFKRRARRSKLVFTRCLHALHTKIATNIQTNKL